MSSASSEYRCTGCSFVQPNVHHSVTLRYPLDDRRYGTGYRRAGWCKVCNEVVDVELLPDAADVKSELAEAERTIRGTKLEQVLKRFGRDQSAAQRRAARLAEKHRGTLAWLAQRRSQPRCLKCGTEQDARPEQESGGELRHSCGGVLEEVYPEAGAGVRVSVVPIRYVMSVDGLILRKERDNRRDD
jgi:hypothetical protein